MVILTARRFKAWQYLLESYALLLKIQHFTLKVHPEDRENKMENATEIEGDRRVPDRSQKPKQRSLLENNHAYEI